MADESKGCLKGCLIGCGLAVLIAVLIPIVGGFIMMKPFHSAIDTRESLEQRFGAEEDFTPSPNGAITSDRIEKFLQVRETLADVSGQIAAASAQMERMEEFDGEEDVSRSTILTEAFKTTKAALGLGPLMGKFFHTRNAALLEVEMGLGEYTYIYVVAYHEQLLDYEGEDELFGDRAVNRRIQQLLVQILENQLATLEAIGAGEDGITSLQYQISAMEEDSDALPWQDGLPDHIAGSVAPFRKQLDDLFFPAAATLDLMKNKSHGGISIESE
jgi:hypothetical protein